MNTITATVQDGVIVPREPLAWPNGTEVEVTALPSEDASEPRGMTEEEQGDSPEAIERWLAEFRSIPPLSMTPEEEAEWIADRKAQRDFDRAASEVRDEKL